jgi:CheY-like chemotaxis protein/anti-sigma regulatory factor (Ser/Thr protein kinase)
MPTILVVDDNPKDRAHAAGCMKDHGAVPLFAGNGVEALEILEKRRPDAVLTGLHMPEMNGLELVEKMRNKHSNVPVVLMTANGSEQDAVSALKAGALSYVPKKNLHTDLCDAMEVVMAAVQAKIDRERVCSMLNFTESQFVLENNFEAASSLVSHLQGHLSHYDFGDDTTLFQIGTALTEALNNAIEHGNLELDSELREKRGGDYERLRRKRMKQSPYNERMVLVIERLTPVGVEYTIRDDGAGFDLSEVPDPKDPQNLLKASGRGLMLIRTFMDNVTFNEAGNEITMKKMRATSARAAARQATGG